MGRWHRYYPPRRRVTPASRALAATRQAARLRLDQASKAFGVHPRTMKRWEVGETHPKPAQWSRLAAFYARYAPTAAENLAQAAGVPSPFPAPPPVDAQAITSALYRAADQLDVSPRRVRAAVREIVTAVADAHGTLEDLARAAHETDAGGERDAPPRAADQMGRP